MFNILQEIINPEPNEIQICPIFEVLAGYDDVVSWEVGIGKYLVPFMIIKIPTRFSLTIYNIYLKRLKDIFINSLPHRDLFLLYIALSVSEILIIDRQFMPS